LLASFSDDGTNVNKFSVFTCIQQNICIFAHINLKTKTMASMGDITGKVVSARLPMDQYIKVLQTATGQNLSVTEYVLLKLFTEDRENALKAEIEQLKTDLAQQVEFSEEYKKVSADTLERTTAKWAADLNKANSENQKLQKELKNHKELIDVLSDEGNKEYETLKSNYTKAKTSYEALAKSLEQEKKERVNAIETIKSRAAIAESLWNKIHKEDGKVPKYIDEDLKKISRY
jgi:NAD(P)-dependent dehydrogenase (short-subunit alcohol dehydrogenase family)